MPEIEPVALADLTTLRVGAAPDRMVEAQTRDELIGDLRDVWATGEPWLVVGGGSRNKLMCQATADAAGIPVVSFSLEGTAVGNIASQLISLGAVKNLQVVRASLARTLESVTYTPRG